MTFRKVLIVLATAFIISALPVLSSAGRSEEDSGPDATEIDYDITVLPGDVMKIENEDIIMNGNVYIYGTLYVNETKIKFGGTSDGQYGVYVYSGGFLSVDHSNVTAEDTTTYVSRPNPAEWDHTWGIHWKFEVRGDLFLNETDLSYIWGATPTGYVDAVNGGIQIYSDDSNHVMIRNCTIFNTENAGIYMGSSSIGSLTHSSSPIIHNSTVDNSTGPGIIAIGDNVEPNVQNCTFRGNNYKGGNYYYGAAGFMANCTFTKNKVFGFSFDPIDEESEMTIYDCHFNNNYGTGYRARRGGILEMRGCTFNGNEEFGVDLRWYNPNPAATPPRQVPVITLNGGEMNDNGYHGIGPTWDICRGSFNNIEIARNHGHGVFTNSSGMDVSFYNCTIFDNEGWGMYLNGSKGTFRNNMVTNNRLGGIMISNESSAIVQQNEIDNSGMDPAPDGMRSYNSIGKIIVNTVKGSNQGFVFIDSYVEEMFGNQIENNRIGMVVRTNNFTVEKNNMSGNSKIGLQIHRSNNLTVRDCLIDGSESGVMLRDSKDIDLNYLDISGSTKEAVLGVEGSVFSIQNSTVTTTGTNQIVLEEGSMCRSINTTIDPQMVSVRDYESVFQKYWLLTATVVDNITLEGVPRAQYIVFSKNDTFYNKELANATSNSFGGIAYVPVLADQIIGRGAPEAYNPVQLTVWKEDYAPYISDEFTMEKSLKLNLEMAINQPPLMLNFTAEPLETHYKRPRLQWTEAYDWNSDRVTYHLNIYDGAVKPENMIEDFTDIQVRTNYWDVSRNLQFHKTYYVVITAKDPWGLSDRKTYSFETVNSKPSAPVVEVVNNPVSSMEDIEVRLLENSTDADTNPVDDITYFIEFYRLRSMVNPELIQSGSSWVLSSENTQEMDTIMVVVKPFDGIEYGTPVRINVSVSNFLPVPLQETVDIEMEEDTPKMEVLDLNTLFEDKDGDPIYFEVISQGYVTAEINDVTGVMDLYPDENWNGEDQLVIEAKDLKPHGDEPNNKITINVEVSGSNDPPSIIEINGESVTSKRVTVEGTQGSKLYIMASADDPDLEYGDELIFSTNFDDVFDTGLFTQEQYNFSREIGQMEIYLPNELVGTTIFTISVSDEEGLSHDLEIEMIVENKNDPPAIPVISSPSDGAVLQQAGDPIEFVADVYDDPDLYVPDSEESLEYSWEFGDGQKLENTGSRVSHMYFATGNYTVTLIVSDRNGEERSTSINIRVEVGGDGIGYAEPEEGGFIEDYGWIVIAIIIGVIAILATLIFIFRREPLQEVAVKEEEAHEALMAKQQEDALRAQEQLQAIMSGQIPQEGPALPSAGGEGESYEALPSAGVEGQEPPTMEGGPGEEVPPQEQPQYPEPPAEQPEQPQYQQPPTEQPQYQAPPAEQPQYQQPPEQPEQPQYQAPPTEQPQYQAPPAEQQPQPEQTQQPGTVPADQGQQQQQNLPGNQEENQ